MSDEAFCGAWSGSDYSLYIGTKVIAAKPFVMDGVEGYAVVYEDGYSSWSPKEAFERAYKRTDDFGLNSVPYNFQGLHKLGALGRVEKT